MKNITLTIYLCSILRFFSAHVVAAQEIVIPLDEIRKTCSGVTELIAKNGTGTIDLKGDKLEVSAGKEISIYRQGVIIQKIEKASAEDYYGCIKALVSAYKK